MRRQWFGFLIAALLILPSSLEGQCRKRILVFLDVSGSMLPLDRSSSSPFQQSLDAVQDLVSQQDFIEPNDVLEVVRFGATARPKDRAQGREEVSSLLEDLRSNTFKDMETDFRALFDALSQALKESSSFNSQVVLLGSDLVHEPRNGMPASTALEDWADTLADRAEARKEIAANSAKTAFVLFTPPASAKYRSVQARVAGDLQRELPRVRRVSSGDAVAGGLSRELLLGLLAPPQLTISRDAQDRTQLAFIVNNPNCYPLRLKTLSVQRVSTDGAAAEPVSFTVGEEEPSLGGTGTPEGTRVFTRPIPTGTGWEDLSSLKGTVETREGLIGTTAGTAGSWLKFKAVRGVLEGYLPAPALRLDLALKGHTEEPRNYRLSVRTVGQSGEAEPLARRSFAAPADLDAVEEQLRRIVIPASRALARAIEDKSRFQVTIEGAEPFEPNQDTFEIVEDPVANRSNLFLLLASGLALLAIVYSFARVRILGGRYSALQEGRKMTPWWIAMALAALVPLATNLFHIRLLRLFSPGLTDWLAVGASILVVFATLVFGIKMVQTTEFGRKVLAADTPLEYDRYRKAGQRGVWLPWAMGLLVTVVFATAWFVSRPPVSERLARDANPPQLRVVSD